MFRFKNLLDDKLFNESGLKKLKEIWKPNDGSKTWVLESHVLYTNPECTHVYSCDFKVAESSFLDYKGQSPIFDVCFLKNKTSLSSYIITTEGHVHVYSYNLVDFHWSYMGHFLLRDKMFERENPHEIFLTSVAINNNSIFWCEKQLDLPENANFYCLMRTLPSLEVLDITNLTLGPVVIMLSNCPKINLYNVGNYLFIIPTLPFSSGLFLVWFKQCGLKLCDIENKCLWSSLNFHLNLPIDFLQLIKKVVGLWTTYSSQPICCHMLSKDEKRIAFLLEDFTLILFDATNNHIEKKEINNSLNFDDIKSCYIFNNLLFIFDVDASLLHIHSLKDGELVEVMCLEDLQPLIGICHFVAKTPLLVIYNEEAIFQITYNTIHTIINSDNISLRQIKQCFNNEQLYLVMLLNEIKNELKPSDKLELSQKLMSSLQSEGLLLALGQTCRDMSLPLADIFSENDWAKICSQPPLPPTKLNKLLQPLVQSFIHLEHFQSRLLNYKVLQK